MRKFSQFFKQYSSLGWCFFLCSIVGFLFITGAPTGGAFSWPDSPRHALNGAFVLDLIREAPFSDPTGYAYRYYSQYPALTILFYPPLFSFLLAPFYAVFGVSQETALVVLFLFYCFLTCGSYFLARQWFNRSLSFGVAAILACSPEIAFWGRQVMLEIPSFAFLVWSAYFLIRHIHTERTFFLYLSIALIVLGTYTKLSIIFVAIPYVIVLLQFRGAALLRDKHSYIVAGLAIVGAMPLIYLTLEFGQANIQSTIGIVDSKASRLSIDGWIWYATKLPSQLGWPAFLAALAGVIMFSFNGEEKLQSLRNNLFLISWFVIGYLFFSAIDLKAARLNVYLLLPLTLLIGLACHMLGKKKRWIGEACLGAVAILTLVSTVTLRPVLYVDGYKEVVKFVSEKAPENSNILFSGYRDGAFIFNMRAHSDRTDVSVIRADKLLLRISIRRELGVEQKSYDEGEISDLIDKMGVHYVVAQPNFWTDLEQMDRLQIVLHSDQFEEVKRFKMPANYNAQEKELVVYRNLADIAEGPINITNELHIIGRTVSGSVSQEMGASN